VPEPIVLDPAEQRVLGSLLEKETTVPGSYPLSLNSLRTACNQSTSREPLTDYGEDELQTLTLRLQERRFVRLVRQHGGRTVKYAQRLSEALGVEGPERALLTVLLLRGPQAAGELKARTERLHPFGDRSDVEACLAAMATAETPLVRELPRIVGQHDNRWVHLLGPVELPAAAEPARDVLADGPAARDVRVVAAYDAVADDYAAHIGAELDDKPFDRWLLGRVAELADGRPIADVGCGTGHVTAHLKSLGARTLGFDLSPAMVVRARADFPGLRFEVGDLRRLPRPDAGWAAIVAHFALVHLAPSELPDAVAALARALGPGGWLSIALHAGSRVRHLDQWWGHDIDLDFVEHDPAAVRAAVAGAGLEVAEWYLRGPLAAVEADTERLYVLAHSPEERR
jgi:uncharacterized protein